MFIKRTLTSLQITQFLVGASYAMIHSFVSYSIPVTKTIVQDATAPAAASVDADNSVPAFLDNIKQMVLGMASKVTTSVAEQAASAEANAEPEQSTTEQIVHTQEIVPCINTTGQTFAIWLNVLYLAPLTYLFVKFFITSYLRRSGVVGSAQGKGKGARESQVAVAEKAGWDAAQSIQQEVYGEGSSSNQASGSATANGQANGKASSRASKPVTTPRRSRHA